MQILMQRKVWKRQIIVLVFAMAAFLPSVHSFAQEEGKLQLYEQKIKAGLIYNFLKYTDWPSSKMGASHLTVCILGAEDPFNGYLQPIEDRTVKQHRILVRHVLGTGEMTGCHLLFINRNEKDSWPVFRDFLLHNSVLTVGDFTGFVSEGGMIEFNAENNRIQIELNVAAINAAHLRIYDSLRRLAKTTQPPAAQDSE